MRRPIAVLVALLAAAASIAAAAVLPAPAEAAAGPACRRGEVRPLAGLTVSGPVCIRYADGRWTGSGTVTLTATRAVSGTVSWGPTILPERAIGDWSSATFSVRPGHPVTLHLDGRTTADPADAGASWSAVVSVPNGIRAVGFEGGLSSPVATRAAKASVPSRYRGTGAWACSVRPVADSGVSGEARLCVRQERGQVRATGTITYTAPRAVDAWTGVEVDGVLGTAETSLLLPAATGFRRTVDLPRASSQVLSRDDTAAAYLRITAVPVTSTLLPLS